MKLFKNKKVDNSLGFGLSELISFLVLFGIAIIIIVIMIFLNNFM